MTNALALTAQKSALAGIRGALRDPEAAGEANHESTKGDSPLIHRLAFPQLQSDLFDRPDAVFFALARSVEERDRSLGRHCERLALMSSAIGLLLGLPAKAIRTLNRSGYIHDIGKITLPDSILLKPAPLDAAEWELMKTHPARGEELCKHVPSLEAVLPIIRHHHEHWDGSGYPDGLRGEEIPLLARILQMADIYDALTSERPYKRALPPAKAISIMQEETRKGWRDPTLMPVVEAALPVFESEAFWASPAFSLGGLAESLRQFEGTHAKWPIAG